MGHPDFGDIGLTESTSNPDLGPTVGTTVQYQGKNYCWVYNAGATSITAGLPVGVFSTTPAVGHVSATAATMVDITDGTTTRSLMAGVGLGTIATTNYGWIQVGGLCTNVTTDGNVVAGDPITLADGAATVVREVTAATNHFNIIGFAPATDASTVGTVFLTNCVFDY